MLKIIILSLALTQVAVAADVYKTVDDNGRVIYTDTPSGNNSEKVDIGEPIVVPGLVPRSRPTKKLSPILPTEYDVTIVQPAPETHINPGVFTVSIQVSTEPEVHEFHQLVILDNGEVLPSPVIEYITPGSHRLVAQVIDENGKILGSSAAVMVYVHRSNLNNRPPPPPNQPKPDKK